MKAPRKRAKGGGAKPRGPYSGKTEAFSTRCTPETLAMMREIAQTSPGLKSVSQVAEKWLQEGYERTVTKRESPHVDALIAVLRGEIEYVESKFGLGKVGKIDRRDANMELALVIINQLTRKLAGIHSITLRLSDEKNPLRWKRSSTAWGSAEIAEHYATDPHALNDHLLWRHKES